MTRETKRLATLLLLALTCAPAWGCGDDKKDPGESDTDSAVPGQPDGGPDGSRPGDGGPGMDGAASDAASGPDATLDGAPDVPADGAADPADADALDGTVVAPDGATTTPDAEAEVDAATTDAATPTEPDANLDAGTEADAAFVDAGTDASIADASYSDAALDNNDAVLGFVQAANREEIVAGEIAQTRATNQQVVAYANDMVAMHSSAKDTLADFGLENGLVEGGSRDEDLFRERQLQVHRDLRAATDAAFDRLYMESQVAAHTEVLGVIDATLLPTATEPLRSQIQTLRPVIAEHLQRAQTILAAL
jgi:putative membrane protein